MFKAIINMLFKYSEVKKATDAHVAKLLKRIESLDAELAFKDALRDFEITLDKLSAKVVDIETFKDTKSFEYTDVTVKTLQSGKFEKTRDIYKAKLQEIKLYSITVKEKLNFLKAIGNEVYPITDCNAVSMMKAAEVSFNKVASKIPHLEEVTKGFEEQDEIDKIRVIMSKIDKGEKRNITVDDIRSSINSAS